MIAQRADLRVLVHQHDAVLGRRRRPSRDDAGALQHARLPVEADRPVSAVLSGPGDLSCRVDVQGSVARVAFEDVSLVRSSREIHEGHRAGGRARGSRLGEGGPWMLLARGLEHRRAR